MRIVQANLQWDYGGAERHVLLLAQGLRDSGHEVILACHPAGRLRLAAQGAGIQVMPVRARHQFDPATVIRLAMQLRRLRPDVLHLHTPKDYLTGSLAAHWLPRTSRPALVLTRHLLLPLKPMMRCLYCRTDAIVCLNCAVRDNLRGQGIPADRLHLILGAIDTAPFEAVASGQGARAEFEWREGVAVVGIMGRLVPGKGHEHLLEAAALLKGSGTAGHFVIIGDGPERAALEAQALRLKLESDVMFTGFRNDTPNLLGALDILVLASTVEEVLPLTLMEGMAAQRAIVATNVGGVPEIVQNEVNGLLVPPADAAALAAALGRVLEDQDLRARLAATGAQVARARFALPRLVEETERLYQGLRLA